MKIFATILLVLASLVAAFGQATVMNDTNTLRILKPSTAPFWASNRLDVLAALDLDLSINSGVPNGSGALVHWSQLAGVPAGFADGTDDGAGGGGASNFIASVSADFQVLASALSLTNATGTGQFVRASVLSGYQATDSDLDDLADGTLSGSKIGTGISGDNVSSGTVADARIAATIARLASPAFTGSPTVPTASAGTSNTLAASTAYVDRAVSLGGGGGSGGLYVDGSSITGANIKSNWDRKFLASGTNVTAVPQEVQSATSASWAPDFAEGRIHEVTLSGNLTLNAPSNVNADMIGQTFTLVFVNGTSGGFTISSWATNYLFGTDVTGLTLTTNAGFRDYASVMVRRTNVFDVVGFVRGYAK